MPQTKYVIFKNQDAQQYLTPAQKQNLMDILRAIAEGRRQSGKSVGDLYFALNLKDKYALPAVEAYIQGIHNDGLAPHNQSVQEALDVALEVKQTAALNFEPGLPS